MNVIALILARSGSKGLKNKNIKRLRGYNLIQWSVFSALESSFVKKIIISSDYLPVDLGNFASKFLWKRPKKLATDFTLSFDVIKFILSDKRLNFDVDYVVLFEPPCPFRNGYLIDEVIKFAIKNKASSVVTLKEVGDSHPIRMKRILKNKMIRDFGDPEPLVGFPRQMQEKLYLRDQAVYVLSPKNFFNKEESLYGKRCFGYVNYNLSINIDSLMDFKFAQFLIKEDKSKRILLPNTKSELTKDIENKIV